MEEKYLLQLIKSAEKDTNNIIEFNKTLLTGLKLDSNNDHFAFMCFCFVSKQLEHFISICSLINVGQHRDAELIARSMLEGFCYLAWADLDKEERSKRWRYYLWVEESQQISEMEKKGKPIDSKYKSLVTEQLQIHGKKYLAKKKKNKSNEKYHNNWHGHTAYDIFTKVQGGGIYDLVYKETSRWIHWTPSALSVALNQEGEIIYYSTHSIKSAIPALICGFHALGTCDEILCKYLNLDTKEIVETLLHFFNIFDPGHELLRKMKESQSPP